MSECLPVDSTETMCHNNDPGFPLISCMKPKGHSGDRHGYDLGFMSGAWGYVPEGETK